MLAEYQDLLLSTVREAGREIMHIYRDPARFEVEYKGDESPLTAADKAANRVICENLLRFDSSIPIVSEESRQLSYSERATFDRCWMVDPLDGTKEFIKRNGEFTVNIALIVGNESMLGIVYVPTTNEAYIAAKGEGAWRITEEGNVRLNCRSFARHATGLEVICSRSHLNDATKEYLKNYDDYQLIPKGSSLKFTLLAQGGADIYPRIGPTMEWDTAAAQVILEEAGGVLLDFEHRTPLRYNKAELLNPNFIAAGIGELV